MLEQAQDFGHGGYYPRAVLREELLEEVHDDSGTLAAAVRRNRYGAEVLSLDALLIADVDLRRAGEHPRWGTHVYRTAAGLRVLCTTHQTCRGRLTQKPWRIGMSAL